MISRMKKSFIIKYSHAISIRKEGKRIKESLEKYNRIDYVLFNTPIHGNLGDHAITIAENQLIQKWWPGALGIEVPGDFIDTAESTFLFEEIKQRNPKKIFFTGGGNLGTLWTMEEDRFKKVLREFHNYSIFVFPQSIYFDKEKQSDIEEQEIFKSLVSTLRDFRISLREKYSYYYFEQNIISRHSFLVPDIVLSMKYEKRNERKNGILICLRNDKESILSEQDKKEIINYVRKRYPGKKIKLINTVAEFHICSVNRDKYISKILKEFSKAELIITDRLHGMEFAAITSSRCIVFDNLSHKVRGVYEWIHEYENIKFAENLEKYREILNHIEEYNDKVRYNNNILLEKFDILKKYLSI